MKKATNLAHKWAVNEDLILGVILGLAFLLTLVTIKNYGTSFDEPDLYDYADNNLSAYRKLAIGEPFDQLVDIYDLSYHGPAYLILGNIPIKLAASVLPALDRYDAWHLMNFSVFLVSAWLLYGLCQRLASRRAALLAALIYLTQPLLWGHAIMNPKDPPFMAFFIGAVTLGVEMVDRIATATQPGGMPWFSGIHRLLGYLKGWKLSLLAGLASMAFLTMAIDRAFSNLIVRPIIVFALGKASLSPPGTLLNSLFTHQAARSNQILISAYVEKALRLVDIFEFTILVLAGLGIIVFLMIKINATYRWTILAGAAMGIVISIRVLGPAVAGLVLVFMLTRRIRRPLPFILVYLAAGTLTAFLLWPYLWNDPLIGLLASLKVMSNFPWQGVVQFEEHSYRAWELPWYYLPKLISIQLTLPLIGLSLTGIGLSIYKLIKRSEGWREQLIPLLWFLLPLAGAMIFRPNMYDNFRQFLFMLPPLFLFAAITFDRLVQLIKPRLVKGLLPVLCLMPGVIALFWLFPYQYVYYNGLVGWTGQVGRQYETDYWGTSMCEAGSYLDSIAPEGSTVAFTDSQLSILFADCTHKAFKILVDRSDPSQVHPDYSVISSRYGDDLSHFQSMQIVKIIGRGKTVFAVVKKAP